jgi:hypothetical protein
MSMLSRKDLSRRSEPGFGTRALLALLLAGSVEHSFAATAGPEFDSPQQAAAALFTAVRDDDRPAVTRLLGTVGSSDDLVQDKADAEQFVTKYFEMHRLVKGPDGSVVLYIGAENWPFPVPLISSDGKWRFDIEEGAREIMLRRIGEDESTAIETCRAIAQGKTELPAGSFHGYHFRALAGSGGISVLAYPSEYGGTGVMTFAANPNGIVFEKDLGPKTADFEQATAPHRLDRSWNVAEE